MRTIYLPSNQAIQFIADMNPVTNFRSIQSLRAIAAVMVLMFHAAGEYRAIAGSNALFRALSSMGYSGVDVFFVISGFVAMHTTENQPRTVGAAFLYLRARVLRIYLGYWPFYALSILTAAIFVPLWLTQWNLPDSFFLYFIPGLHDPKSMVLYVSWSLTFELVFYLLVGLSFFITVATLKKYLWAVLIALIVILPCIQDIGNIGVKIFIVALVEFGAGVFIRQHISRFFNISKGWFLLLAALAAMGFIVGGALNADSGFLRAFTFGVGASTLLTLVVLLEKRGMYPGMPVMESIGDASYTLYLAHPILLTLFHQMGVRSYLASSPRLTAEIGFFGFLFFCLLFAYGFYRAVERRLYRATVTAWR